MLWLEYADLEEAAALIATTFAEGAAPRQPAPPRRKTRGSAGAQKPAGKALASAQLWRPRPDVGTREVEGELFLCDHTERAILHLNPVGAVIWDLLADGGASEGEAVRVLAEAFPGVEAARIAADVVALFADLRHAGLIEKAAADADSPGAAHA